MCASLSLLARRLYITVNDAYNIELMSLWILISISSHLKLSEKVLEYKPNVVPCYETF